jgi:hypothetical protein
VLLPLPPPPLPTFASPVVGWLLNCFPPSAFVIACRHATVNALVAGLFCCQLSSTAATAAAAAAAGPPLPPPPPSPPSLNLPSSIAKERGNLSTTTSVPTAAPIWKGLQIQSTWIYLSLSAVFEVCDVVQGNLAISKLLA